MSDKITEQLDKVLDAVTFAQKKSDELGDKITGLEKGMIAEAGKAAADALQAVQEMKQAAAGEKAAMEAEVELLKKKLARGVASGNQDMVDEIEHKYGNQFSRYLRKGLAIDDGILEETTRKIVEKMYFGETDGRMDVTVKDWVAGSNPAGGYFIRPDRASMMIKRVFETSPLRRVANVVRTASDSMEFIIDDNEVASGGWVGEISARPATASNAIGKLVIPVHEVYAMPQASQKMLDDAGFDIESWVTQRVTDRLSRVSNTAFVTGNGSEKPRGFNDYASATDADTYERGKIGTYTSTGTSAKLDKADDFIALQNLLKEDYQARAVWGMKRSTFTSVMTLKASGSGEFLLNPSIIRDGSDKFLLGKEVIFMDDLPVVASNSLSVVYADFSQAYTIVDRIGFRVIRDEYTNKPYVLFYTTARVGGDVTSYDAIKRMKTKT